MTAQPEHNVLPFHAKPTSSFVQVTPETAERWLAMNTNNRKVRPETVARYRRDMESGNWHLAGDPIRFGPDGTLLDGQHRLRAIVAAGVTVTLCVQRGINPFAQAVMDTGRSRTAADAITMAAGENATVRAALARLAIYVERDQFFGDVSHSEILDWLDRNPDNETAAQIGLRCSRRADCPPAVVAYTWLVLSRINTQTATEFWDAAASKVGLLDGDPVIAMTNRFAEARRTRSVLTRKMLLSVIYRAWNARREGKSLKFLRVSDTSVVPEPK